MAEGLGATAPLARRSRMERGGAPDQVIGRLSRPTSFRPLFGVLAKTPCPRRPRSESRRTMEDELAERREAQDGQQSVLASISREMVRLYKEQFGRGPTRTRTDWAGSDVLVCTLESTFTPAERNLVNLGEHERVRDMRMFFQYATVREFCEPVERLTGRKVRSFLSAIDTQADGLAMETFILYPDGKGGPSRIEAED